MVKQDLNIPDLIYKYEIENMTFQEIAKEVGCDISSLFYLLKKHGVQSRRNIKRNQFGSNNASWKGNNPSSLATFHKRIENLYGCPKLCHFCGTTKAVKYDWANMSGNYDDLNDYKRLCRSCHLKYDGQRRRAGKLWNNRFKHLSESKYPNGKANN